MLFTEGKKHGFTVRSRLYFYGFTDGIDSAPKFRDSCPIVIELLSHRTSFHSMLLSICKNFEITFFTLSPSRRALLYFLRPLNQPGRAYN